MTEEPRTHGEIYDLLERCDDHDLQPLVEILTGSPASVLALSRAYERHHPRHTEYIDRIGDEIYRLALEAMSPKDRRRPSYAAMVEAVCRKIGIPLADSVDRNEGTLFSTFAPVHPATAPSSERRATIKAVRTAASKAADGLLTISAWPPFVASMIEISALRRRSNGQSQALAIGYVSGVTSANMQAGHEGTLVIAGEDGLPVLSVTGSKDGEVAKWREIANAKGISVALVPILKSIEPFIAADRLLSSGEFVRVGIEGGAAALSRSKATGAMVGSAIGHKGQVSFLPVAAGAVAWPVALAMLASAYLEQKRFENIERSLEELASSLADVSRFQQVERRSVLTGSLRYFRQISKSVLAGELDDDVLHSIERHEGDLLRVQEHLHADIEAQISAVTALKNDKWTSSRFVKALADEQSKLESLLDDSATCLEARACGFQLLCAYPGKEMRKRARLEHIASAVAELRPDGLIGASIDRALRKKLRDVSSLESKAMILGSEDRLFERITSWTTRTAAAMDEAQRSHEDESGPLSLMIRLERGSPVAFALA